jgi:hypothetical protein
VPSVRELRDTLAPFGEFADIVKIAARICRTRCR